MPLLTGGLGRKRGSQDLFLFKEPGEGAQSKFTAARLSQDRVLASCGQARESKGEAPYYPQMAVIVATEN